MTELSDRTEAILTEYDSSKPLYDDFRSACEHLLRDLIRIEGLQVHSVGSRLKERQSLAGKLTRIGKHYIELSEVTDIVGIRVIAQLEDEVDKIGHLIERDFEVDPSRSVDKRKALDPDRFGYLSMHYICRISPARLALPEYRRFIGLYCEIQVRSILQHAWAEIEHDLGYKAGATIPAPIRRRFSRLAGLLEIADVEFSRLRSDLNQYAESVQAAITKEPAAVGLDDVSLASFIENDQLNRRLDERMAAYVGEPLSPNQRVGDLVEMLRYVHLETIGDLRKALEDHQTLVQRQWETRLKGKSAAGLHRGVGLFHLFQVLLVLEGGLERLTAGFRKFMIGSGDPTEYSEIVEIVRRSLG